MKWLNKAADVFDQLLLPIKTYRSLDPIRSDSRFSALLQKCDWNLDLLFESSDQFGSPQVVQVHDPLDPAIFAHDHK